MQWNGTHDLWQPNVSTYVAAYNQFVNLPSPLTVELSTNLSGNILYASATVEMLDNITTTNNRIQFFVTRNLDGIQSPNYFASVVRYHEQNFGLTTAGQTETFEQEITIESSWDIEAMRVIAIVQTYSGNRQIHQAAMVNINQGPPPDPIMGAPQNLNATLNIIQSGDHNIYLTWTAPEYAHTTLLNYKVFRNDELVDSPTTLNYRDFELEEYTTYTYYVVAVYSHGESEPSEPFIIEVEELPEPEIVLGIPREVAAHLVTESDDGPHVFIRWETPIYQYTTLLFYILYRNDIEYEEEIYDTIFLDKGISSFQTYQYQLTAYYTDGESERTESIEIIVGDINPPGPIFGEPRNLEGVFDEERDPTPSVVLNWEEPIYANTTLTGYRIFRDGSPLFDTTYLEFTDTSYNAFTTHNYYVVAIYTDGQSGHSNTVSVTTGASSDFDPTIVPNTTRLGNNYPNPFNPSTTIYFDLHQSSRVILEVFNLRGQTIKTLVNTTLSAGRHITEWNGLDENGESVGSGIYLYRLQTEDFVEVKRMVLMK